ncbi:fluoride efflux transporter CrcB [Thiomicrorhabdus lithotrophica]|uniref:Fluoride-specific ion channel FluC n=1 Tax=Thiomicrorhabdus lithotrophica TaxID=2949997 RepID=A0ABY8CI12_9GAMM|nr:fluoride efflux transporter CrcB [Thiomicrorhabdus lithotrophica]WEJ63798.1 fluoride efflux transporter CrcB [Thiomicrorhabdus lithotrophica]
MTGLGWFAIAMGGALGATARFALSHQVYQWFGREFAWGTLSVNVLGSFVMGLIAVLLVDKLALSTEWRAFVMVGFLGAFTTFSTFSYETMQYIQVGEINKAFINIAVSVVTCLVAVWIGMLAARQF